MNAVTKAPASPMVAVRQELTKMEPQFEAALPAHIPTERFMRVVMTSLQNNPNLLSCNRRSLWNSAMKAAQDGLLPNGIEGAIVPFKGEAQWMPMVSGILKKVRNSGELKSITARLVYGGDSFRHWVDETGEHVHYEPADTPDKDTFRRAFAVAVTTDGGSYIEVMDAAQIEAVRKVSRATKGPWFDWWEEMVKKTVIRRLAKRLPMSTDLDDLIRRDDSLYDFDAKRRDADESAREAGVRTASGSALDAFASMGNGSAEASLPYDEGRAARKAGESFRKPPYEDDAMVEEWRRGWQDEDKTSHEGEPAAADDTGQDAGEPAS